MYFRQKLQQLEKRILGQWEIELIKDKNPYQYLLDEIGDTVCNTRQCIEYLMSMMQTEFIDAIDQGFDDLAGFTFFYLVRYLTKETNLLLNMEEIKNVGGNEKFIITPN